MNIFVSILNRFIHILKVNTYILAFRKSLRNIRQMKFEVCSACQKSCDLCAHDTLKKTFHGYHLSLEDLERFIHYTRLSKYFIKVLWVQGPGEPTLWKHFNDGIAMLYRSGVIGSISIETNGLSLDKLERSTWSCLDKVYVSIYPDYSKQKELDRLRQKYSSKIVIREVNKFIEFAQETQLSTIPCTCYCDGPMLIKDKIFYYCGPPGFTAAKRMNIDILEDHDLYTDIKPHYLDNADYIRMGNMEMCRYCLFNSNAKVIFHTHNSTR